jgi:arylsulfatase A-like enzyme
MRNFLLLIVTCQFTFLFSQQQKRPNIVLIMADDMGFSDLGCYGSEISTPNLDQLAKEGTRLRQFYNGGICAPSRASLLTGQNPHKAGMGFFNQDLGLPAYQGYLNKESLTIAEVLKSGGYNSYLCGKWHVGNDKTQWPLQRGFDKFFGSLSGAFSFFDDIPITKNPPALQYLYEGNERYVIKDKNHYLTDVLTDKAISYLNEQPNQDPFLLYMAYTSPHWPMHAKPKDIAKYKGRYDLGWDSLRTIRHKKMIDLGIVDANQKPVKDNTLPLWNKLTYDEKKLYTAKMEVYAAMVDNLDQNIGRLVKYLKSKNQLDNTLIVFISDNGAEDWDFSKLGLAINRSSGPVGTAGSNESYTQNWAQLSNVPLRAYKSTPYEGGLSSPFIARLPGVITANKIQQGSAHIIDLLPSFIELAGVSYPTSYNGVKPHPLQGKSFIDAIKNDQWNHRGKPLFHEWAGNRAVWDGKWKAVSTYPANKWELYDLSIDRTESNNLVTQHPDVLRKLESQYQAWANENAVTEWNPNLAKKTGFSK